ncbi:hypothetical protein D3C75_1055370 [compost metagenome]
MMELIVYFVSGGACNSGLFLCLLLAQEFPGILEDSIELGRAEGESLYRARLKSAYVLGLTFFIFIQIKRTSGSNI